MNVIEGLVEVKLKNREDFLKIVETLTRIGVASSHKKKLFQSCHILHKRDSITGESKYYILHFKELFLLDNKPTEFSENDMARRNTIANILAEWGLLELVDSDKTKEPVAPIYQIKIISFKDKNNWELSPKYNIGKKK